jgi:cytochrome P450
MVATFKDPSHYSNEGRLAKAVAFLPAESRAEFETFEGHYRRKSLIHSDPPDHTRFRGLITMAFTPRVVEAMRPRGQEIVNELLDDVQPSGQMDVIRDLAIPLPVTVLSEIMGVPKSDVHLFKGWADDLLAFQGVNKPAVEILRRSQRALVGIRAYLGELLKDKRRHPGEDLLSELAAAESEGDKLSETESDDPDRFDIRRPRNRHIAFGLGIHFCVGATLARTEGQMVFSTVMECLPRIRLLEEKPNWDRQKPNSRMLKTLPVLF